MANGAIEFGLLNIEGEAEFSSDFEDEDVRSQRRHRLPRLAALGGAFALGGALAALLLTSHGRPAPAKAHVASAIQADAACHTTKPGEACFSTTMWAKTVGIHHNASLYPGMTPQNTFEDFQEYFYKIGYGHCPHPCPHGAAPAAPAPAAPPANPNCLCLFDVDRTLTCKQDMAEHCGGTQVQNGVFDTAFGGGDLVLSKLGAGLTSTFCGKCHLGIVSMGGAGGPKMKQVLEQHLPGTGTFWSGPHPVQSPLVIGCPDAKKAECARGIVDWYKTAKGVEIPPAEVYFFDDHDGNTNGFAAMGFNARQISCGSRDGPYGLCGGDTTEIVRAKGTQNCR